MTTSGESGEIQVGRVSERDGTRHHGIRADGHAACGRGKVLLHHVVPLTVATAKGVCRTRACRKLLRTQLDLLLDRNATLAEGPVRRFRERTYDGLRDLFRSPAEYARDEAMVAEMRAHLLATTYADAA